MKTNTTDSNQNESLDQNFWNERWAAGETAWDAGKATPPIAEYMAQFPEKEAAILIPGCGSAHEAEALAEMGFQNITLLDIAPEAVARLQQKFADKPQIKVILGDFFQHEGRYDLILEQTFFCAIPPQRRAEYVQKAASLLRDGGRLVGVLFDKNFDKQGPPFGGHAAEYRALFSPYFDIQKMEACYNSIAPRAGTELFIHLVRK